MARLPRYFVKGQPQSVIHRGYDQDTVFFHDDDCQYYLDCLEDASQHYGLAIHAYVLMDNHVHLLATPATARSLSRTLQSTGRRYGQYFNTTYDHTGTLWEGRYRATIIDAGEYLLTCMRYIELNPVRAGIVKRARDYPWSSYGYNAYGETDALIRSHRIYRNLGPDAGARQKAYRALFKARIPQTDLDAIRAATNKAWVLGDQAFRDKIEALSGRRASPRPKGRTRKANA